LHACTILAFFCSDLAGVSFIRNNEAIIAMFDGKMHDHSVSFISVCHGALAQDSLALQEGSADPSVTRR
jgi:hypothetical protein